MVKVSVIVPVYNVEQYLDKCLNSLVKQTLSEIEYIIVNDGTNDNSQTIIDKFVSKYPDRFFSYIKENGGLSSARNYGLRRCNGEYVAFLDSDDYVETTMYEALYRKAKEGDFDLVVCDFNEIRDNKICPCSCHLHADIVGKDKIKEAMINYYPSAWNKIYKRSFLNETNILFKEGVWFEDVEFAYRLLPYVNSIGVVHKHFYQYLIRKGSITSKNDLRIYHYIENWNGVIEFYKSNDMLDEYYSIIEYCYVRYLFATFIKTAAKFDKKEFSNAVEQAIFNVNEKFPNYKTNKYINEKGLKNKYLKYFSKTFSKFIYIKYHN